MIRKILAPRPAAGPGQLNAVQRTDTRKVKKKTRFAGLKLRAKDRVELRRMLRGRGELTARIWRRVRVLLLLDEGGSVRGTATAVGGYLREISRVGKRYLQAGPGPCAD